MAPLGVPLFGEGRARCLTGCTALLSRVNGRLKRDGTKLDCEAWHFETRPAEAARHHRQLFELLIGREEAREVIAEVDAQHVYDAPIVTEVTPVGRFWPAEDYHQTFFVNNPSQPYCRAVVAPKVAKFRKQFLDRLKA